MKELIAYFINIAIPRNSEKGSILMYHSISADGVFSTVSPTQFDKQLQYLSSHAYHVISLIEMIRRIEERQSTEKCVALTFDDGYVDFYTTVYPLLKKYKMHGTVFVPTDLIGKELTTRSGVSRKILGRNEIRELSNSEWVTIAPHSKTHRKLSSLSFEEAKEEIEGSKKTIESLTGKTAHIFAYPFGDVSKEIADYMRESGQWRGAVSVVPGLVQQDLFLLSRNAVDSSVGMQQFRMKVSNGVVLFRTLKKWIV